MNTKGFILGTLLILVVIAAVILLFIWPGPLASNSQASTIEDLQAQIEDLQATSASQDEPHPTDVECPTTQPPTSTPPEPTTVTDNSFAWVLADTKYGQTQKWNGPFTFKGPAVCEWYKDGYPPNFGNEGFVFLMDDEQITFPQGQVGTCWSIPDGNPAINKLESSYRHLIFYSNQLTATDLAKLDNYFYVWPPVKGQHAYMHLWLDTNDLGECTFFTQEGCPDLAEKVIQPPDGVQIKPIP